LLLNWFGIKGLVHAVFGFRAAALAASAHVFVQPPRRAVAESLQRAAEVLEVPVHPWQELWYY
jgi:hypothetical protein